MPVLLLHVVIDGQPTVNEATTVAYEWSWHVKPVSVQLHLCQWECAAEHYHG